MNITAISRQKAKTTTWAGGTTTEFFLYPSNTSYGERNFIFRISSATVDTEISEFTSLPDYERILAPLSAPLTLQIGQMTETKTLQPQDLFSFDGGLPITSYGRCVDFNVMYRKGSKADVQLITKPTYLHTAPMGLLYVTPLVFTPKMDASTQTRPPTEEEKATANGKPCLTHMATVQELTLQPDTLYQLPTTEETDTWQIDPGDYSIFYITLYPTID